MRQNFRRDKLKKEEARRKKQEEKRARRLHKKDDPQPQAMDAPAPSEAPAAEPLS